jgi:hypothetical protein
VTVSGLAVDAGTVTFHVSWEKPMPVEVWVDSAWVFVDYNNNGVMKRLPVTGATATAGTVTTIPGNDKGVWVAGNARTNDSFSAKVELFTEIKDVAGACAYASNYPPVGKYTSTTNIAFTGTPGYDLVFVSGATTHTESNPYTVPAGYTVQSFTDKTGAPGMLVPATYTLSGSEGCVGTGVTLTLSGSQLGWRYQLYRGATAVGGVVNGTGSALAFPDAPAAGGYGYMVRTVDNPAVVAQRAMQVSDEHTVAVNAVPASLSLTANPATICNGQSSTLTASATSGASYSIDNSTWQTATTFNVKPTANASYTLYVKTSAGCSATRTNAATITVNPLPAATVTAKSTCYNQTAALSATLGAGTTTAMTYTWKVGGTSSTTTANSETSQALTAATTYTVQLRNSYGCVGAVSAPATITVRPAFSPGTITSATTTIFASTAPTVTIQSATRASGGYGTITYQWRRTGTSSATLTGTTATYTLSSDAANYNTAGTYYFNRYAKAATCNTAYVAATGTYTLYVVNCPLGVSAKLCTQCCWSGSTWVDCCATTSAVSTIAPMSGYTTYYEDARSDKDGRANTAAITTYTASSAVGKCKALGTGWYLPAYEELYNMRTGSSVAYGNLLPGANFLPTGYHWSSTERDNVGRFSYSSHGEGVLVYYNGVLKNNGKTGNFSGWCVWRP